MANEHANANGDSDGVIRRWWSAVRRWWRERREVGPAAEEVKALTEQFYVTLKAQASALRARARDTEKPPEAELRQVDALLAKKTVSKKQDEIWTWSDAYEVEQRLVQLYDDVTLASELGRRLMEARWALRPTLAGWYESEVRNAEGNSAQRALLARLVNDLQWRYTVNEAVRGYSKQIARRTGWIFIVVVLLFAITVSLLALGAESERGGQSFHEALLVSLAALAGVWGGAAFSMLTSLKTRLERSSFDDLKLNRTWGLLLARVLIGLGAALVLYFFFRAGLLEGSAFPTFPYKGSPALKDVALLVVWCFLAGFSEKLVPGLLAKTEAQIGEQAQPPVTARPGPGEKTPPESAGKGEAAGKKADTETTPTPTGTEGSPKG